MILNTNSLMQTIDAVNERLLFGQEIPPEEGLEAARWISSLQGKKGAYRSLFAPTPSDYEQGIRLFTGERLVSASARHILGQEAARVVCLFGRKDPQVRETYQRATAWMEAAPDFIQSGTFCCGRCTLAFWRHIWVGDFKNKEARLVRGLQAIKESRLGDGKWSRFPFFYAIYTLLDLELEPAIAELHYAQKAMENYARRPREGAYTKRRSTIFEKALERVSRA